MMATRRLGLTIRSTRGSVARASVSGAGRQAGFTLIEIMVVIVILAILAGLVVPKILGRTDEARRTAAKLQIKNFEQALSLFKLDNVYYPSTEQGLEALVTKPSVGREPKFYREGGYLQKVPQDPWGNPYIYRSPGEHGEYEIISFGPDGSPGGDGKNKDLESWNLD